MHEANDVIEAIRKGNIDAVFIANDDTTKILVSKTADQTYRRFIEKMSEGVVTLDSDGIIVYCNSSFAGIVGLAPEKVVGANIRSFIPPDYIDQFEQFFMNHHESNSKLELLMIDHKHVRTYFIVSLNTLHLEDFVAINLVWTDVTAQKKAEERLTIVNKNLKRAIEELLSSEKKIVRLNSSLKENIKVLEDANIELAMFAYIASHDLQEPLRKIITYSGILIDNYHSVIDKRGQHYLNNMQRASERMRNLINDILAYSHISEKGFLFEEINLQTIVNEVLSNLEVPIHETKAKIIIEKELPVIEANSSQMIQLFQNILSNAIKFKIADTIPEITITYEIIKGKEIEMIDENRRESDFCVLRIIDNGIGFRQEFIDKIFIVFQRLNNSSVYPGTGIGLAICKKVVEKHSGFITAEGKPDDGSVFTITLPVVQRIL